MSQDAAVQRALEAKRRHEAELMRKANVVAVGVGRLKTGEAGIVVSVSKKVPEAQLVPQDRVPKSLDGVPVEVVETGEIRAH